MNLLLLEPGEVSADGTARLRGRRLLHAREILRAAEGDALRVGVLDGDVGLGIVERLDAGELVLRVELQGPPPARAGLDLLLAVPRPKALKRLLPAIASLGIDRLVLLNAARVEKSYLDAGILAPEELRARLCEGLEQARDTRLPLVSLERRFRPFVEDALDGFLGPGVRLVAQPAAGRSLPPPATGRRALAIGPEGGWVPFELDLLAARGFAPLSLGPRPLRTEVAVPYALGALCGLDCPPVGVAGI